MVRLMGQEIRYYMTIISSHLNVPLFSGMVLHRNLVIQ